MKPQNLANGSVRYINPQTRTSVSTDVSGRVTMLEKPGLRATAFRADGRAARIEQNRSDGSTMLVERGRNDVRRVEVVRPGGVRVVTQGQRGFVERRLSQGYVARTYVVNNRSEVRVYRTTVYQNVQINSYVPAVVYRPAFYGWAAQPWREPVTYVWVQTPSSGAYIGFFAPEPRYPSASAWLADYMIAENLRHAYEAGIAAGSQASYQDRASMGAPMTREVKDQLAQQVRQQIELDQMAAAQPAAQPLGQEVVPAALAPKNRVFVVNSFIDVTSTADAQSCSLTPGDVVQRSSDRVSADGKVDVVILSAKNANCTAAFATALDLATLQDMHNQFRENIAAGLGKLATSSSSDGIPVAPAAGPRAMVEGQAPVDEQARGVLMAQMAQADQSEEEAKLASDSAI
jgi:hypothetical protein